MKKYRITYKEYMSDKIHSVEINAECQQDAITNFFDKYSGMFLGIDFVDYV